MHPVDNDPLSTGAHLGDLTDEYPDHNIVEYISGGCKQYALKLQHKESGEMDYAMKIRGITLNWETCQSLKYDVFREKVLNFGNPDAPVEVPVSILRPTKFGDVYTDLRIKRYEPVLTKGLLVGYRVRWFGQVWC